jgi:transcriptional regulator with XRE-family HTH domain
MNAQSERSGVDARSPQPVQSRLDIGARIRKIRKERGLSIAELARGANLSPSFISQAERDMTMPSVRTLNRLAEVLQIDVQELLGESAAQNGGSGDSAGGKIAGPRTLVVMADHRTVLTYHGSKTRYELLSPELKSDVEFLWVKAPPGTMNAPHPFRHGGRECGVVIQGKVEFWAGDERHVLGPGDSIYLGEGVEHRWKVLGEEEWQAVWVIL